MSELETHVLNPVRRVNGEVDGSKPFVIRGHHLKDFAFLIRAENPVEYAAEHARYTRFRVENYFYLAIGNSPDIEPLDVFRNLKYFHELFGFSTEDADRVEKYNRQTDEQFLNLPDNHPAEIVEGIPDILCEGCARGIANHCRKSDILSGDGAFLDAFLENLDELNLPKPTITQEPAKFSDGEPQRARRIKTTIGAVKKILKEGEFDWLHLMYF
ncbi:MAG: hypothetical protein Q7R31_04020 [Candidatus Levybacteria bacterium]|nr:hypothetical protein [Candidatus Levybacteria bacterium]